MVLPRKAQLTSAGLFHRLEFYMSKEGFTMVAILGLKAV